MEDADHDAMHQHRHLSDSFHRIGLITGAETSLGRGDGLSAAGQLT